METDKKQLSGAELDRRFFRRAQPYLRRAATRAGFFSTCALSKCRRAKQCLGRHPDAEIGIGYKRFPPCVTNPERHHTLIRCGQEISEEIGRALAARGYTPEEADEIDRKNYTALCEADDWPEDPLARVSGPPDRAKAQARRRKRPKRPKGPSTAGKAG